MSYEGKSVANPHDLTHSPVGLWQLDGNLLDSSGNGFHLTVETGTERYSVMPGGLRGMYFDASTTLYRNVLNAELQISGSVTLEAIVTMPEWAVNRTVVSSAGQPASDASTYNYMYLLGTAGTGFTWRTFWEYGAGSNVEYSVAGAVPGPGLPVHVAMTRDASDSNRTRFFANGRQIGPTSGALTTPDGGASTIIRIGGNDAGQRWLGHVASLKLVAACLTPDQILSEYNRTLGPAFGRMP